MTTDTTLEEMFTTVLDEVETAHLVAFDRCHKIYLAMDEIEAKWFRDSNYTVFQGSPMEMYLEVIKWWNESCGLRFIQSVTHNETNRNAGYKNLVPQGAGDNYEEEETK